jgi:predicted GH43/DUF377 family glycosyl hydrolase
MLKISSCFIPGESRGELVDKLGEFKTGVGDTPLTQYWGEKESVYDRTPREFQIQLEDGSCFTAHFFCSEIIVVGADSLIALDYKKKNFIEDSNMFYEIKGDQDPKSPIKKIGIAYGITFSSGEPHRHSLPSANSQEFHNFVEFLK